MELLDGLLIAATTAGDRGVRLAMPGLAPGIQRALEERSRALAALSRGTRHAHLKAIVTELAAVAADADLPPRARAILAADVPRELGTEWAHSAPPVRRGFRVQRGLKVTLRRLARPAPTDAQELELVRSAAWRE